ncbi:hypothetical protein [Nostoc sp.]|uniref:hypothetical protein n=1 Tax=Nostoc sp. TaxID=1180 RepID=UPI002FFAFE7D
MFAIMATEPIITNEEADDIPILLTQIERMGIQSLIDQLFATHRNWQKNFQKVKRQYLARPSQPVFTRTMPHLCNA